MRIIIYKRSTFPRLLFARISLATRGKKSTKFVKKKKVPRLFQKIQFKRKVIDRTDLTLLFQVINTRQIIDLLTRNNISNNTVQDPAKGAVKSSK